MKQRYYDAKLWNVKKQYVYCGKKVFHACLLESKKVKIREVHGHFSLPNFVPDYDIEKLKKDIETNGLQRDIIVYRIANTINGDLVIKGKTDPVVKYQVGDGNHRCFVLKELYGDDYEINININPRPFMLKNLDYELFNSELVDLTSRLFNAQREYIDKKITVDGHQYPIHPTN